MMLGKLPVSGRPINLDNISCQESSYTDNFL